MNRLYEVCSDLTDVYVSSSAVLALQKDLSQRLVLKCPLYKEIQQLLTSVKKMLKGISIDYEIHVNTIEQRNLCTTIMNTKTKLCKETRDNIKLLTVLVESARDIYNKFLSLVKEFVCLCEQQHAPKYEGRLDAHICVVAKWVKNKDV